MNRNNTFRSPFKFSEGDAVIAILSTAGMICFISAFFYTTIANVSFVYGTMPLATYVLALTFLKEKISIFAVACCLTTTLGMIIMTLGNSKIDDFIGIALALGMTFFMASLTVATKFYPNTDTVKATYLSAFLGAIVVLPFASFTNILLIDYFWLAAYGIVNVGLGFGIYLLGVVRLPVLAAALIGLIEIPLAPIWSWMLFGEQTTQLVLVGGLIIVLAAVVYTIGTQKRRKI